MAKWVIHWSVLEKKTVYIFGAANWKDPSESLTRRKFLPFSVLFIINYFFMVAPLRMTYLLFSTWEQKIRQKWIQSLNLNFQYLKTPKFLVPSGAQALVCSWAVFLTNVQKKYLDSSCCSLILRIFQVTLPLNVVAIGDITVIVYHARYVLGRPTGIKILQYQFHSGFLSSDTVTITCSK